MIVIAGLLIGAIWGGLSARRRGGSGFDVAQYAAVFGLIGTIVGLALTVGIDRMI